LSPVLFFSFTHSAATELSTLSLHDALPILRARLLHRQLTAVRLDLGEQYAELAHLQRRCGLRACRVRHGYARQAAAARALPNGLDRKSTRLNSSHVKISYAVFCLKKKKKDT